MATFWACNIAMKYLYRQYTNRSFLNDFIAIILCFIVIPLITLVNIVNPKFAKICWKSQTLRNSKILLFIIIEGIISDYILNNGNIIKQCLFLVSAHALKRCYLYQLDWVQSIN
ncbi:hypothetical protein X798_00776 [Onchocerca flexuosa]|uniref:Uncharacterized protein n=1 Tax=Onchocerca flexuosa TaxID=387005 RepID=A0A238C508_9BILA|nr:hypothetical protein X798_00776 [Onchocerca flexuosa]